MVTVNLIKLCVGIATVEELEKLQMLRRNESSKTGRPALNTHITRNKPKRSLEIINNGSLYWVIRRQIRVRQRIIRIDDIENLEGKKCCGLILDPQLVRTETRNYRPFQGWRYLEQLDAPPDLAAGSLEIEGMPLEMEQELRSIGLL